MTDPISNERLARELWKKHGGAQHGPRTETLYMPEANFAGFIADLIQSRRQSPAGVGVKPLEWVDADEGMCTKWRSAALGGHYELVDFGKDDPGFAVNFHWGRPLSFWFIQGEPDEWGPTGPKMFPTLEDAKSAAQADCDSRILSSISEKEPAGVEPVAWRRDAADGTRKFTAINRVAEIWRDQGLNVTSLYASPTKAVTITDERNALLAEVISLIEDDMYGLGEIDDVPERIAFNKALRRQINRITSRLIVSAALSSEGHNG